MDLLVENFGRFLRAFQSYSPWRVAMELILIGTVVLAVVQFLQGTRGARLLKGIVVTLIGLYVVVSLLRSAFELEVIAFLYDRLLLLASLAIVVVFQPELRRALMRLGETKLFRSMSGQLDREIENLIEAAVYNSKRRVGMLIAIEREVGLGGLTENATRINADISAPLLNTIFYPKSPLHDLGVIISNGRIAFAGVQFPLAESGDTERELGSRHRAAVGMSQESDAVILVVSEETGDISIAEQGVLMRRLTPEAVRELLTDKLRRSATATLASTSGEPGVA